MVGFQADRNVGTLFCPASPRPAVRRAPRLPGRPLCVRVLDSTGIIELFQFPDMHCMKMVYRDK